MIKNNKELGKIKRELWEKAEKALYALYGDMPDIRILNRFYSEKMAFENSDAIILWNLAGEIMRSAPSSYSMPKVTGTTGSCFTAYLLGAASDNPLPIHYHCRECCSTEFVDIKNALPFDMQNKTCSCGGVMRPDGFDIPYEMNLGDAHTPHICFSVPKNFLEETKHLIFEQMKAFYRVGELGNETDYTRFVLLPYEGKDLFKENVNFVNDKYNGFPTVTVVSFLGGDKAKRLIEETGEDLFVFSATENYLSNERIVEKIASGDIAGIPILDLQIEGFASMKDALKLAKPKNTYEILKVYDALHGSGTWTANAENLISSGIDIDDIPTSRDDMFMLLRNKLYETGHTYTGIAYELTNKIKWGKLDADSRTLLEYLDLPEWFIPYAEKIQYMFPKAHSVQNLREALTFMWYKIKYPCAFDKAVKRC